MINKIEQKINGDLKFFKDSSFFDNNIKQKIQVYANVRFEALIRWCSLMDLKKPRQINYIGKREYVEFFLFCIFRQKETINTLWNTCGNLMNKGFKKSMISGREHFMGYLWELYLIYFFSIKKLSISKSKKNNGPDIKIEYQNQIFWVECVCPKCGNSEFKVPEIELNKSLPLPTYQIEKRLEYNLINKAEKYQSYIKKKWVLPNDKKYIAINTSDLSQYGSLLDSHELELLSLTRKIDFFENYKEIDGLIYSHASIFDYSDKITLFIIKNDYSVKEESCQIYKGSIN